MGGVSDDANTTAMKVTSKKAKKQKAKICCASFMNCRDSHLPVLSLRARDFYFEYSTNRGSNTTTTISLSQQLPTLW